MAGGQESRAESEEARLLAPAELHAAGRSDPEGAGVRVCQAGRAQGVRGGIRGRRQRAGDRQARGLDRGRQSARRHPPLRIERAVLRLAGPPARRHRSPHQDAPRAEGHFRVEHDGGHVQGARARRPAGRQSLAGPRAARPARAGQGRVSEDVGRVHRDQQEDPVAAASLRVRDVPGARRGHHRQRDEPPLVLRRQDGRSRQQDGRHELRREHGRRQSHRGHVQDTQDHPAGCDRVGQLRQQQSLSVEAGGVRDEPVEHLRLPRLERQGSSEGHRALPGAGRTEGHRQPDRHVVVRRVQEESVPRSRPRAHRLLHAARELRQDHPVDRRPLGAGLQAALRLAVLAGEAGVPALHQHGRDRRAGELRGRADSGGW